MHGLAHLFQVAEQAVARALSRPELDVLVVPDRLAVDGRDHVARAKDARGIGAGHERRHQQAAAAFGKGEQGEQRLALDLVGVGDPAARHAIEPAPVHILQELPHHRHGNHVGNALRAAQALVGHADHAPGGQHGPAGVACVDRGVDQRRQQFHPAVRAALMLDARDHAARDAEGGRDFSDA